jgi:hypothetical protein
MCCLLLDSPPGWPRFNMVALHNSERGPRSTAVCKAFFEQVVSESCCIARKHSTSLCVRRRGRGMQPVRLAASKYSPLTAASYNLPFCLVAYEQSCRANHVP